MQEGRGHYPAHWSPRSSRRLDTLDITLCVGIEPPLAEVDKRQVIAERVGDDSDPADGDVSRRGDHRAPSSNNSFYGSIDRVHQQIRLWTGIEREHELRVRWIHPQPSRRGCPPDHLVAELIAVKGKAAFKGRDPN